MKLRIGVYVPIYDQVGGAEVFASRLSDQLVRRRHEVRILTSQPMSRWRKGTPVSERRGALHIIRLPVWERSQRIFALMWTLEASILRSVILRELDVLLINKLDELSIYMGHLAHGLGIKTICRPWASGPYGDIATFSPGVMHDASAFDWLTALTEHVRDEAISWGFPLERIDVIPNGVDPDFFCPPAQPPEPHRVIFVGAFRPEKQVDLLLNAFRGVQDRFADARLTLIGGAANSSVYLDLATKLDLAATFLPPSGPEVIRKHLQQSSIFVMSGVSEGMSNALLEAMSVGLAPVVSDTPGNRAVIQPQINGLCYQPDSASALSDQLGILMTDDKQRIRLGAEARNTVLRHYTLAQVADRYLALFEKALKPLDGSSDPL